MDIMHSREDFTPEVIDELKQIIGLHYAEVGPFQFDFDVDWDKYLAMEESGCVRLFVARSNGVMVGYGIYIITTHTHFATTVFAMQDALYVNPECRGNGTGINLISYCESMLGDCDAITQAVTPELDFAKTLRDNGYVPLEYLYVKRLERLN